MTHTDFIVKVLTIAATHDDYDNLHFSIPDEPNAPLAVSVICSDLFFWGSADAEPVTPETLPDLEASYRVAAAVGCGEDGSALYCVRQRKERPQGACYKHYDERIWPLFDACGPRRETGTGNPMSQEAGQASWRELNEKYKAAIAASHNRK